MGAPIFVNLTPHLIHMPDGSQLPPIGYLARCTEETVPMGDLAGNPIVVRRYGKVENLPDPHLDTWYIVSHMTRVACPDRFDLLSPGDLVRNEKGEIVGCTNFVINSIPGTLFIERR